MKVYQLIEHLQQMPLNSEVYCTLPIFGKRNQITTSFQFIPDVVHRMPPDGISDDKVEITRKP